MKLSDLLGGASVDFTLPSLGGAVPDTYCCTSGAGGKPCVGVSTCKDDAGKYCPTNSSMCANDACKEFVNNYGSCVPGGILCGGGACTGDYT